MGKTQVPRCVHKDKNPKYRRRDFNIEKDAHGMEIDKSKAPMKLKRKKNKRKPTKSRRRTKKITKK